MHSTCTGGTTSWTLHVSFLHVASLLPAGETHGNELKASRNVKSPSSASHNHCVPLLAQPGMVSVASKKCEHFDCRTWQAFNVDGASVGRFCAQHKQPGMFDVTSKRCERDDCKVQPKFNQEGATGGRFCVSHKQPGMVDVMSRK